MLKTIRVWLRVLDETQDQLRRDGYILSFGSDLERGILRLPIRPDGSGKSSRQPAGFPERYPLCRIMLLSPTSASATATFHPRQMGVR